MTTRTIVDADTIITMHIMKNTMKKIRIMRKIYESDIDNSHKKINNSNNISNFIDNNII